ncbi:conjugal transfer protein TraG N-terminal domain-containing protein [Massilia sp.]|uniref:conjugal transfer protein TraG N-terminal domain-containing protein n=1 Tax=Massilia sp. TaxID=1882437 RepID=UPI00352CA072
MVPDQVIYTANGDLTTLRAVLNGVAMVCQQNLVIWGFAMLAAMWSLFSMTTTATVNAPTGGAGGDLAKRVVGLLIPFCLAIFLTAGGMKSRVTVESGLTGATTTVDNVPALISVVPATASLVSKAVGQKLETAMQATGTDYPSISATGHGFVNPLKTLLTSRTAVLRLGGIASEVNAVLSTCLGADSGTDYAKVANHVLFAGNLPAADAGPTPISVWTEVGDARTSIGMLLAEAAQNTDAIVTDVKVGTNDFATCADAANQVGADIDAALKSDEFRRVVQGAVNTADQPNVGGAFGIHDIASQYTAARTANLVSGGLAGGVTQANAEVINLLFSELVKNDLECLRADGTNKSTCLAMAVQANEIERNNIQAAANGFESLMYAGAFANQITAVVIGLGPVIVLFMMWSGVGAARNMKVAAHMIVWPLLVMNVGAELINAMIYIKVSNFLEALSQSGFINQSTAVEVYKNFSLEIGTASHLMATLPILMSTIFALGESAALVKISESMGSGSKDESKAVNPAPVDSAPLVTNSSMARAEQGVGGTNVSMTGAIPAIATTAQFGNMQREASSSVSSAHQKMEVISEGNTNLAQWMDAIQSGKFSKVGVSESTGMAIRDEFNRNYTAAQSAKVGDGISSSKDNFNVTQAGFGVGAEVGLGVGAGGAKRGRASIGGGGSGDYSSTTGANDNLRSGKNAERDESIAKSQALAKSFNSFLQSDKYRNSGSDDTKSLQRSFSVQKQYAATLSESKSISEVASDAVKNSSGFVSLNAKIGGAEMANQMKTNVAFRYFQLNEGRAFGNSMAAQPYLERAHKDMEAGVTDRIEGDPQAREAMARHRAAILMAQDPDAKPEDQFKANEYLLGSSNAMLAARFTAPDIQPRKHFDFASPKNSTGVNESALVRQVNRSTKHSGGLGKSTNPSSAEKLEHEGYGFAVDVAHGVEKGADSVHEQRLDATAAANRAKLAGAGTADTRVRTRESIGENFKATLPEFLQGDKKPSHVEIPDKK